MKKFALAALVIAAVVVGAFVFRNPPPQPDTAKVLRVGIVTMPPERGYPFNSTGIPTIYTYRAIFDGLTFVNEAGEVQPFLATSWEQVDPLTWRFKLREGVTFSNGKPFTADAVVFAVKHIRKPENQIDSIARELIGVADAEAEGPHSVLIRTSRVEPLLPAALEQMMIVEPEHFARVGKEGFAAAPVATGPFMVSNWGSNKIELAAFKGSWRAPKVDRIELLALPETSARVQALESGQIDIAVSLGYEHIAALEQTGARSSVSKTTSALALTFILTKLPEGHPLTDVRVRRALNYAVDKPAYIKALLGGLTQPASQPTTASGFGYNPELKPYPYDPERAKALLAEAGYPNGFSFTAEVTAGGGAALPEVYQQAAVDLGRIGVNMSLRVITLPQLIRLTNEGDFNSEAFGMNFDAGRTTDALRPTRVHSCLRPHPWICDRALTAKIEKAYDTGDLETRRKLTQEIMASFHDDPPVVWLHEVAMFEGLSPRVRNYRVDNTVISYHDIDLAE